MDAATAANLEARGLAYAPRPSEPERLPPREAPEPERFLAAARARAPWLAAACTICPRWPKAGRAPHLFFAFASWVGRYTSRFQKEAAATKTWQSDGDVGVKGTMQARVDKVGKLM